MKDGTKRESRGRPAYYTADCLAALRDVWDAASEPCGENLHPLIPEYVQILRRDDLWRHSDEATGKLLAMSVASVKRHVHGFARTHLTTRGKGSTKPGSILSLVPVRSDGWRDALPGTIQIDTVAHCGHTLAGDFVYTVNATDTATLWGERRAQWNKGAEATTRSMAHMDTSLPYPVLEWHPDSGSEFINWLCLEWCEDRGQTLSRSRPGKKNDNCHVEERNGHVVRRWLGYARFDCRETVDAINLLYDVLTPYLNHFVASRRTCQKERIGARWRVTREQVAKTPYQRVLEHLSVSVDVKEKLRAEHAALNPLLLKREIDRRLKAVFDIQKRHGTGARD